MPVSIYKPDFYIKTSLFEEPGKFPDLLIETDDEGRLKEILFIREEGEARPVDRPEATAHVARQLDEYFAGERRDFELELAPRGTGFQTDVWKRLTEIPYGETRSYLDIAVQVGKPTATRAVGAANGANPIVIVQPCHRVIGANGKLTGFGGGLPVKAMLLALEGALRT